MSSVAEVVESRELIVNLTLRELRGRYKRSVLGWTWSLLNRLSTVVIYSIVFGVLLNGNSNAPTGDPSHLKNFTVFLLCGLLPWNFFGTTLNGAMGVLTGNAGLIRKVYFPREDLVLSFVASGLVTFFIEMGVLLVILVVYGNNIWPWIPAMLLLMGVQSVFVTGFSLGLAVLNVYDQHRLRASEQAGRPRLYVESDGALRRDLSRHPVQQSRTYARQLRLPDRVRSRRARDRYVDLPSL